MSVVLLAALALSPAESALEAGVACYEGLDYVCADERIAEALAKGLEGRALERARYYQAQVALAFRDEARARTAVRALLAVNPRFEPEPGAPQKLRWMIEQERPEPPPAWTPLARADVTSIRLFGQDADRWSEGLGFDGAAGVLKDGWLALEVTAGYSDHVPRTFTLEGMTLVTLTGQLAARGAFGPVRLSAGVGAGAARVAIDGVSGDDTYWGALFQVPLGVTYPLWEGLGVGFRVVPSMLVVGDGGRAAASWLLPLTAGLRYAP
jgi:hypothetical protein